jgi:outer membrane protein OmpA-like peptidoglycan-associated protein
MNSKSRQGAAALLPMLLALLVGCAQPPVVAPPAAVAAPVPYPAALRLAVSQTDRGVMIWLPDNVLFAFGSSDLSPEAGPYLDRVAGILVEKTDKALVLEGHTDNVGAVAFNQTLSERRAKTVLTALAQRQVAASRLRSAGFGLHKPLAPNDSDTGRRLNRRVELIVLEETVERLMRDEPANSFESAVDKLKAELEAIINKGGKP